MMNKIDNININKYQYNIEYIKKSNINPILKIIYLRNKQVNPTLTTTKNASEKDKSKNKTIRKRKSSVSHYSVII
jgi:hypothetical protein